MHTESFRFSDADQRYVTDALGRKPIGVIGVGARDDDANPLVIINLPLASDGERWLPFPTLYWLVDPALNRRLAEIERKGGVRDVEEQLAADDKLMQAHLQDNKAYAKSRWAVLTQDEIETAEQMDVRGVLEHSGIGGVADHKTVKCLHAQAAYHLARHDVGTTVGKLLAKQHGLMLSY